MPTATFGRRELMLGLVYPAVLGTVLYSLLNTSVAPAVPVIATLLGRADATPSAMPFQPFKAALLFVTFLFYLSDYFYVMYTKEYLKRFFCYSIAILIGLTFTVAAVDSDRSAAPEVSVVFAFYAVFMALYFVWDANEWLRDRDPSTPWYFFRTKDENERWFYAVVLMWESMSFVALVVFALWAAVRDVPQSTTLLVLGVVTVPFLAMAAWKRRVYVRWVIRCTEAPAHEEVITAG